jgi:hypothetical protein
MKGGSVALKLLSVQWREGFFKSSQLEVSVLSLCMPNVESVFSLNSVIFIHILWCVDIIVISEMESHFFQFLQNILYLITETTYSGEIMGKYYLIIWIVCGILIFLCLHRKEKDSIDFAVGVIETFCNVFLVFYMCSGCFALPSSVVTWTLYVCQLLHSSSFSHWKFILYKVKLDLAFISVRLMSKIHKRVTLYNVVVLL